MLPAWRHSWVSGSEAATGQHIRLGSVFQPRCPGSEQEPNSLPGGAVDTVVWVPHLLGEPGNKEVP